MRKDVWVTPNHFLGKSANDVGDVEAFFLSRDFGVQNHLEQNVSELAHDFGLGSRFNGLGELVRLFDRVRSQAAMRLLFVPGTALFAPEGLNDF